MLILYYIICFFQLCSRIFLFFFFSSRRRHTRCALVTGVQTCALPISAPEQVVSVTAFEYDAQGGPSRLTRVHRTGRRTRPVGTAYPKSLPSIDLTYTDWRPGAARFAPLSNREAPVPQPFDGNTTQFVDLYGEGRPGVLANQPPGLTYWPPSDGGALASPRPPNPFPVIKPGTQATLTDVAGNGQLDLVVTNPSGAGVFRPNQIGRTSGRGRVREY